MAAPPGRHRPGHSRAEVFYAIHDAAGCWATTQRGYHCCRSGCQDMLRRHVVAPGVLSLCMHFSTSFLVNTSGRAQGCCCGGVLRGQRGHHCWRSYWCSQAFKTHATISPFRPLFWRFLLLSISLLCCLFCIVSQAMKILFVRSASRWSIGDEQGHRFLRFPAPRLLFNGAQFHSPEVRGFPRLLHCEQSVQQSR